MSGSSVIAACPGCGKPLVRAEVGVQDVRCALCLGTYRVFRGRLLRRFSRVVTHREPFLLMPGQHHREEELRLEVGAQEPLTVAFRTPGQWDALPLQDDDDAVVVGALDRKGRFEVGWVAEARSGAATRVRDLRRDPAGTAPVAGLLLALPVLAVVWWAADFGWGAMAGALAWLLGTLFVAVVTREERRRALADPETQGRAREQETLAESLSRNEQRLLGPRA